MSSNFFPLRKREDTVSRIARRLLHDILISLYAIEWLFPFGNGVYEDKPSAVRTQKGQKAGPDPARKLAQKKDGPYRTFVVQNHTLPVNIYGIHNVNSIDRVIRARENYERKSSAEEI